MRETAAEVPEPPVAAAPAPEADAEEKIRPPCTLVIFGASGDLTRRLLAPAIAHLSRDGAISPDFAIIGLARTAYEDQEFREAPGGWGAGSSRRPTQGRPGDLPADVQYIAGDFGDPALYEKLRDPRSRTIEAKRGADRNRIFYLATPPEADPDHRRVPGRAAASRGRRTAGRGSSSRSRSGTTSSPDGG